ncbi:MAG: ATP-binding protein [Bacteroidota bacterium]
MLKISQLYSKVKDVYIELHDYSFFHSPVSMDKDFRRFVGRKTLIARLSEILNNCETKSGAYLVTGYRGVGKTSLVNKVLSNIADKKGILKFLTPHLRSAIYLLLLFFITAKVDISFSEFLTNKSVDIDFNVKSFFISNNFLIKVILVVLIIAKVLTIIMYFIILPFLHLLFINNISAIKIDLEDHIQFLRSVARPSKTNKAFYRNILSKFIPSILALLFAKSISNDYQLLLSFLYLGFLIIWVEVALIRSNDIILNDKRDGFFKWVSEFWVKRNGLIKLFKDSIYLRLNYSYRTVIKINLGHEELKEVDILRLVTKTVYDRYSKLTSLFWRFPINHNLLKFLLIIMILNILSSFWNYENQKEFYRVTTLGYYFPSQLLTEVQGDLTFEQFLNETDSDLLKDTFNNRIIKGIAFFDYQLTMTYFHLRNLFDISWLPLREYLFLVKIPPKLDYIYIIVFVLLWYCVKVLSLYRPFGIVTHTMIKRRLKILSLRISAQLTNDSQQKFGNRFTILG